MGKSRYSLASCLIRCHRTRPLKRRTSGISTRIKLMLATMSAITLLMISPAAPVLKKPKPILDPFAVILRMTCDAEVCLNALTRTAHAWHDELTPETKVAATNSIRGQVPSVFIMEFMVVGATRHANKHKKLTTSVHMKEKAKRFRAFSFSFGSMIAWLYSSVAPAAIMPDMAPKEPETPKSEGEKRRLITGERAKPI